MKRIKIKTKENSLVLVIGTCTCVHVVWLPAKPQDTCTNYTAFIQIHKIKKIKNTGQVYYEVYMFMYSHLQKFWPPRYINISIYRVHYG